MNDLYYGKQLWNFEDVDSLIDEFMELYNNRPIKNNRGGMLSTHCFLTWYVIKKLRPRYIIESGVFKGQGTWLFRQALPETKIFSIDPALEKREYIDEEVVYFSEDFSMIDWEKYLDPNDTLVFFDDHQDAYLRLQQMKWMNFKYAMFDDNYPILRGDCYSLKKILSESGFKREEGRGIVKTLKMLLTGSYFKSENKDDFEIPPNSVHAKYVRENIETYITLPPLCKSEKTRWGDDWDEVNFPTPPALLSVDKIEKHPIIYEEANSYTWICYVKLK